MSTLFSNTLVFRIPFLSYVFDQCFEKGSSENMFPKKNLRKKSAAKITRQLIRCECGFEILLIPDLKKLAKAIEEHAAEHVKQENDPVKAALEKERILDDLTAQALRGAATA